MELLLVGGLGTNILVVLALLSYVVDPTLAPLLPVQPAGAVLLAQNEACCPLWCRYRSDDDWWYLLMVTSCNGCVGCCPGCGICCGCCPGYLSPAAAGGTCWCSPRLSGTCFSLQWERPGHFDASSFILCHFNGGVWQEAELGLVPLTDCRVWDVGSSVDPCRLLAVLKETLIRDKHGLETTTSSHATPRGFLMASAPKSHPLGQASVPSCGTEEAQAEQKVWPWDFSNVLLPPSPVIHALRSWSPACKHKCISWSFSEHCLFGPTYLLFKNRMFRGK